jgi:Family of unknown function (DUF6049)
MKPGVTVRRAAVLLAALAMALAPAFAGQALAGIGAAAASRAQGPSATLTIDSIGPQAFARPGMTITVSGQLRNGTGAPLQGIGVQLWSSGTQFTSRSQFDTYLAGTFQADQAIPGATAQLGAAVGPGQAVGWRISFQVSQVGMNAFGAYPLAAAAFDPGGNQIAVERTFLPFWPGQGAVAQPTTIAWIWPLIDQPHRGACAAMLDNSLAANLAGGRLGGLLRVGRSYAASARLTWAVDPALLDDASVMTSAYRVLTGSGCTQTRKLPASKAAADWLQAVAGQQNVFTTPYADPDVAALTHQGLDADLGTALTEGSKVADRLLDTHDPAIAWPPDGVADSDVLDNVLARDGSALGGSAQGGIQTVVLDSSMMRPNNPDVYYTPDAVTQVQTGVGKTVEVLLSDHTITSVLAGASSSPGSATAVSQRFLAETAMIAAEAPNLPRSIVVAPPRRWNPGSALASQLLRDTVSAPWLVPQNLSNLKPAKTPAGVPAADLAPLPPNQVSPAELSPSYLAGVRAAGADAQLLGDILNPPVSVYPLAIARLESSAWRGSGQAGGTSLLNQTRAYLDSLVQMVAIIPSSEVTLGGNRGTVPVSIANRLPRPVRVRLQATVPATREVPAAGRLTVKATEGQVITLGPGQKDTVRLQVQAQAVGVNEVQLRLLTPQYTPIPFSDRNLRVRSTAFGALALVIIAVALGVLVLTSVARIIRRGIREGRPGSVGADSNPTDDGSAEAPDELADARGGAQPDTGR